MTIRMAVLAGIAMTTATVLAGAASADEVTMQRAMEGRRDM